MPKKRNFTFNITKNNNPSYVHPSLASSKAVATSAGPASVNDKLNQLRREAFDSDAAQANRELAASLVQRSVPPSLNGILGLSETAPPAPKPGSRQRAPHRTPGPAPPRSWLNSRRTHHDTSSSGSRVFGDRKGVSRPRPAQHGQFLKEVGEWRIKPTSLTHYALKSLARHWNDIDEEVIRYLGEWPQHLRVALLAYISNFGPDEGLSAQALELLLLSGDLSCLDLTAMIGWSISLKSLSSILRERAAPISASEPEEMESWDSFDSDSGTSAIKPGLRAPTMITKLSLACPKPTVSWNDLLALTNKVPTITHLSLARWPLPTRIPSLVNATSTTPLGLAIPAGGSTAYAALDGHWTEARTVLRHLSRQTYCLKYLDVQGCDWLPALISFPENADADLATHVQATSEGREWAPTTSSAKNGPDWSGSWKRLERIRLGQMMRPEDPALVFVQDRMLVDEPTRPHLRPILEDIADYFCALPGCEFLGAELRKRVKYHDDRSPCGLTNPIIDPQPELPRRCTCHGCGEILGSWEGRNGRKCSACEAWHSHATRITEAWLDCEATLRSTVRSIQLMRRKERCDLPRLVFDFGWIAM